jgi:hypothetical protein
VRRSSTIRSSPDGTIVVACLVSNDYSRDSGATGNWYSFHPYKKDELEQGAEAYVALGCGSEATILLIPFDTFVTWLGDMDSSSNEGRFYWHVRIERAARSSSLQIKHGRGRVDVSPFLLAEAHASTS